MSKTKRLFISMLTLLCCCTGAWADEVDDATHLKYTVANDEVTITGFADDFTPGANYELAIPDEIRGFVDRYSEAPKDWYLFSNTRYEAGPRKKPMAPTRIAGTWESMREALDLPDTYQFYSLKDTGITEMLEAGVPAKYVKELADHHSLAMTERYIHKAEAKRILEWNTIRF